MKNNLQIMLITYNRSYCLERTLQQLFAENSPIKNCALTILDNNSTDNTFDVVKEYQINFPNIKYKKNYFNINGNGNILRAFELGAQSSKKYLWVLCDDDYYDWSNWNKVESLMEQSVDCIGVANYVFPNDKLLADKAYQFFQLTFVPGGIYKIENITEGVISNMYDTVFTMFQQSCVSAHLMNSNKKITFLKEAIVENGFHVIDKNEHKNDSYTRGQKISEVLPRRKEQKWIFGFAQIVGLLNDKKLQRRCLEVSILYKDIYGSLNYFMQSMQAFKSKTKIHFLLEILPVLPKNVRKKLENDIFETKICVSNDYINCLWKKSFFKIFIKKYFKHKVVTILGFRISFKKKNKKRNITE